MEDISIFEDIELSSASISFAGASGTGKTTLAHAIAELMPTKELITNITRKVAVEDRGTPEGQQKILQNYIKELRENELEGFICDRTLFDVCAYSLASGAWDEDKVKTILDAYVQCEFYPTYLFYVPIEFEPPTGDPDRDVYLGIRRKMDDILVRLLSEYSLGFIVLHGNKDERMVQIKEALAL